MVDKLVVCLLLVSTLVVATWSTNIGGTCPASIRDANGKKLTTCTSCVFNSVPKLTGVCKFEKTTKKDNGQVCTFDSTCNIARDEVTDEWVQRFCSSFSNRCVTEHSTSMSTTTFILIGVGGVVLVASSVAAVVFMVKRRRNNSGGFTSF